MLQKLILPKSLMLVACTLAGCTYTTATPVSELNPYPEGVRVNAVSTKFVSTPTGLQVVSYSDPCRQYAVRFGAVLAKNDTTLTMNQNGTLSSIALKLDSTDVIPIFEEIAKGLTGFPSASDVVPQVADGPVQLQVYDIECGPNGTSTLVAAETIMLPVAVGNAPPGTEAPGMDGRPTNNTDLGEAVQ